MRATAPATETQNGRSSRPYAAERLAASGEAEIIAARHANYIVDLFEEAGEIWERTPDIEWLRRYA